MVIAAFVGSLGVAGNGVLAAHPARSKTSTAIEHAVPSPRLMVDSVVRAAFYSRIRGMDILDAIGNTSLVRLRKVAPPVSAVKTDDAKEIARRIAREEALFAGTSSGANVVASIEVAKKLGRSAKVVTLMVDSGLKYLSTDVYRR
jgi:hypothetical protein